MTTKTLFPVAIDSNCEKSNIPTRGNVSHMRHRTSVRRQTSDVGRDVDTVPNQSRPSAERRPTHPGGTVESLHRSLGNQAVRGLSEDGPLRDGQSVSASVGKRSSRRRHRAARGSQSTLAVSSPGDRAEKEAERVADAVMRTPNSESSQSHRDEEQAGASTQTEPYVHRRLNGTNGGSDAPPFVDDVLRAPGRPLDGETRDFMEARFGYDLSDVRVHTNQKAAASARALDAAAYTVGRDVVFGSDRYAPGTDEGRRLLAHELAHTVQQSGVARASARNTEGTHHQPGQEIRTNQGPALARSSLREFLGGAARGIADIPGDVWSGAGRTVEGWKFWDEQRQLQIHHENTRIANTVKTIATNPDELERAVRMVVEHRAEAVSGGAGRLTGRLAGYYAVINPIAVKIAKRVGARSLVRFLAGAPIGLLIMQGVAERAAAAADRLQSNYFDLYRELYQADLEMTWFLIEPYVDEIDRELNQAMEDRD